jgi:hypothetical protein
MPNSENKRKRAKKPLPSVKKKCPATSQNRRGTKRNHSRKARKTNEALQVVDELQAEQTSLFSEKTNEALQVVDELQAEQTSLFSEKTNEALQVVDELQAEQTSLFSEKTNEALQVVDELQAEQTSLFSEKTNEALQLAENVQAKRTSLFNQEWAVNYFLKYLDCENPKNDLRPLRSANKLCNSCVETELERLASSANRSKFKADGKTEHTSWLAAFTEKNRQEHRVGKVDFLIKSKAKILYAFATGKYILLISLRGDCYLCDTVSRETVFSKPRSETEFGEIKSCCMLNSNSFVFISLSVKQQQQQLVYGTITEKEIVLQTVKTIGCIDNKHPQKMFKVFALADKCYATSQNSSLTIYRENDVLHTIELCNGMCTHVLPLGGNRYVGVIDFKHLCVWWWNNKSQNLELVTQSTLPEEMQPIRAITKHMHKNEQLLIISKAFSPGRLFALRSGTLTPKQGFFANFVLPAMEQLQSGGDVLATLGMNRIMIWQWDEHRKKYVCHPVNFHTGAKLLAALPGYRFVSTGHMQNGDFRMWDTDGICRVYEEFKWPITNVVENFLGDIIVVQDHNGANGGVTVTVLTFASRGKKRKWNS